MILVLAALAGAKAYPTGSPGCNVDQHKLPIPGVLQGSASIACTGLVCTVTASSPFLGIVVAASSGTITAPAGLKQISGGRCVTHSERLDPPPTAVTVTLSTEATVRATVVFRKSDGIHAYAVASAPAKPTTKALVVGAGPGGLAAARAFASFGIPVTVYERGPSTTVDFDGPIKDTYLSQSHTWEVKGVRLGTGVGGTQNVNGAVFAPGSASDLAASVGVSLADASMAQTLAAGMVEHETSPPMMWACRNSTVGCDRASAADVNTLMSRRSIAYNLPSGVSIVGGCTVHSVNATTVIASGAGTSCVNVDVTPDFVVVVAAGALVSPELLGREEYSGWNHYYQVRTDGVPIPPTQTFEYRGDLEINTMKYGSIGLEVTMMMKPTVRETHRRGVDYVKPIENPWEQAWHFAGTVEHTLMRVGAGSIFIGDASALQTPFNCHTSMPAAAAGVLAARASLGLLEPVAPATEYLSGAAPWLFVSGSWVVLVGVAIHTFSSWKWHHYWLMPLGAGLIGAAVVAVHVNKYRLQRGSSHGIVGYIVLALLIEQIISGSVLRPGPRPRWLRILHRASGLVAFLGILSLYLHAAVIDDHALALYTPHTRALRISAWLYALAAVATLARAAFWFLPSRQLLRDPLL